MANPFKAHMAAAKHPLRFLAGTLDSAPRTSKVALRAGVLSDANWGTNLDNVKSISSDIVFHSNAPVSFKVRLQGLTAQTTMVSELVAEALEIAEANVTKELGAGTCFDSVPLCVDNTAGLHFAGNQAYGWRVKLCGKFSPKSSSRRAESPSNT